MPTIKEIKTSDGSHHVNPARSQAAAPQEWLAGLAERFGTPFYLYDAEMVEEQVSSLRASLPPSDIFFSFKSNPNPAVASLIRGQGCRADLTSPGEIDAALLAGFDLSQALYGGPGKSVAELETAIRAGIRHFSIESEEDLSALNRATEHRGVEVNGLIRINPKEAPKAKLAMSGVASQFGFEEDYLEGEGSDLLSRVGSRIHLKGIHIYWGTQIGGVEELLACFTAAVTIAGKISAHLGFPLEILNLGGGFPWPYSKAGEGPDLSGLAEALADLRASSPAEWWFESGRYLTARSGTLVTRVMDLKTSKDDKQFLILDTGIHHLGGMSGLGRIPRFSIDIEVPANRQENGEITVDVVGQLCTPLDCIGRRITLPRVEIGDLVTVPNTGAYGPTASVLGFLSRPTPVEVVHRAGDVVAANRLRSGHETLA